MFFETVKSVVWIFLLGQRQMLTAFHRLRKLFSQHSFSLFQKKRIVFVFVAHIRKRIIKTNIHISILSWPWNGGYHTEAALTKFTSKFSYFGFFLFFVDNFTLTLKVCTSIFHLIMIYLILLLKFQQVSIDNRRKYR